MHRGGMQLLWLVFNIGCHSPLLAWPPIALLLVISYSISLPLFVDFGWHLDWPCLSRLQEYFHWPLDTTLFLMLRVVLSMLMH